MHSTGLTILQHYKGPHYKTSSDDAHSIQLNVNNGLVQLKQVGLWNGPIFKYHLNTGPVFGHFGLMASKCPISNLIFKWQVACLFGTPWRVFFYSINSRISQIWIELGLIWWGIRAEAGVQ